jgi:hypothetical protein
LKRIETWQSELSKREKLSMGNKENSTKNRPKTGRNSGATNLAVIDPNTSPQDQKIIRDLQQLIAKQEQLLRGFKTKNK